MYRLPQSARTAPGRSGVWLFRGDPVVGPSALHRYRADGRPCRRGHRNPISSRGHGVNNHIIEQNKLFGNRGDGVGAFIALHFRRLWNAWIVLWGCMLHFMRGGIGARGVEARAAIADVQVLASSGPHAAFLPTIDTISTAANSFLIRHLNGPSAGCNFQRCQAD